MRRRFIGWGLVVAVCVAGLVPSPATAARKRPPPTAAPAPDPEVQALIGRAKDLFLEAKFSEALDAYSTAYARTQVNGLVYMMARCHEEMGRYREALDLFERFLQGDAPPEARGMAQSAIRILRDRVARASVVLQVAPFGAEVEIDGVVVGKAPLPPQSLQPGRHDVRVTLPGYREHREQVVAAGGEEVRVVVALVAEAPTKPPAVPPALPTGSRPAAGVVGQGGGDAIAGPVRSPYVPWKWATLGTGAALVVSATVTYVVGELNHRRVADAQSFDPNDPASDLTQAEAVDLTAAGDVKKRAGYVLWGVGGAALVASTVLFVLDAVADKPSAVAAPLAVSPVDGGACVFATGRF